MSRSGGTAESRVEFRKPGPVYSALVGLTARRRLPVPLRGAAYRAFARAVGADLAEAELDLRAYSSFGDLFARRLRPGSRPLCEDLDAVISPCDGVLAARGTAVDGALVQAKGRNYQLEDLVVDPALADELRGGAYATIYLSPRDYHRVHAPIDGHIVSYDYIPGALWPVNPRIASSRDRLLVRNERVVIQLDAGHFGKVAVVMVGASGVGNIKLEHAERVSASGESAAWRATGERRRVEVGVDVQRGDELGAFRLGSTVVMVFRPGKITLEGEVGQAMRFGERMGSVRGLPRS
jgi:phosphatidylserine decarboxylase